MPVYNGEKYLDEAINSILTQTYQDFEFIIVDDCSSDNSLDIIMKFADIDKRIKIILNDENLGIAKATNRGIEAADGEFIALMDQDDISLPERFEKEVDFLQKHPDISVVGANSIRLDKEGDQHYRQDVLETPGLIRWGLLFRNQIQNPTALMRRTLFSKHEFKYENFMPSQDYHFWLRISKYFKLANLQDDLLIHRIHGLNTSTALGSLSKTKLLEIRKEFVRDNLNCDISDEIAFNLTNPTQIMSLRDARSTSKLILSWARLNKNYCSLEDWNYIKQKTNRMLRDVWVSHRRNLSLFPYVLYALVL
jgi:glycosyltransferase involved in cell wall biosynthesis